MVFKEFDNARLLLENQNPERKVALDQAEGILLTAGVAWPLTSAELISQAQSKLGIQTDTKEAAFDLDSEWERQADALAGHFAKPLKMTQSEYKGRFFDFRFPQPEAYKGRFDTLTLVQTPVARKLPLSRIVEIAGIDKYFDVSTIKNWSKSKFQQPVVPYATWLHDGLPNLGRKVIDVRNTLEADSRGGKTIDGVSRFIQNPNVLDDHFIDLPGDQVDTGNAPCLNQWSGRPKLNHDWIGTPDSWSGSMVAGVEVRTQPLKA